MKRGEVVQVVPLTSNVDRLYPGEAYVTLECWLKKTVVASSVDEVFHETN